MLYYGILCYTMLYYVILCYTMLYYVLECVILVILCYTMFIMVIVPYSSNWYWFFRSSFQAGWTINPPPDWPSPMVALEIHRNRSASLLNGTCSGGFVTGLAASSLESSVFGLFWSITLEYYTPVIYGIPVLYGLCNVPFYAIWPGFWTIFDPMFFPLHKLWVSVTNTNSRQCTRPWLSWSSCSQRMSWLSHA